MTKDISVQEVKQLKKQLEYKIGELIEQFKNETGILITGIDITLIDLGGCNFKDGVISEIRCKAVL